MRPRRPGLGDRPPERPKRPGLGEGQEPAGWERQEADLARAVPGGRRTPGSGSGDRASRKGDVIGRFCRVEGKETGQLSISVKRAFLSKIAQEARSAGQMPAFGFAFDFGTAAPLWNWLAFELSDAQAMLEVLDAVRDGRLDDAREWARRLP
jgi:hypothetical protein